MSIMKISIISVLILGAFIFSCAGKPNRNYPTKKEPISDPPSYDANRGEGKFSDSNVVVGKLHHNMATNGKSISETKCFSCHKITDEKLVGPGWKGVSERRKPYWIMNFITNPDAMIDKDPEVQAQLELCLVRMPNQNLSDKDARSILEFMRQNDDVK